MSAAACRPERPRKRSAARWSSSVDTVSPISAAAFSNSRSTAAARNCGMRRPCEWRWRRKSCTEIVAGAVLAAAGIAGMSVGAVWVICFLRSHGRSGRRPLDVLVQPGFADDRSRAKCSAVELEGLSNVEPLVVTKGLFPSERFEVFVEHHRVLEESPIVKDVVQLLLSDQFAFLRQH